MERSDIVKPFIAFIRDHIPKEGLEYAPTERDLEHLAAGSLVQARWSLGPYGAEIKANFALLGEVGLSWPSGGGGVVKCGAALNLYWRVVGFAMMAETIRQGVVHELARHASKA
jgi:hypothetical protein